MELEKETYYVLCITPLILRKMYSDVTFSLSNHKSQTKDPVETKEVFLEKSKHDYDSMMDENTTNIVQARVQSDSPFEEVLVHLNVHTLSLFYL